MKVVIKNGLPRVAAPVLTLTLLFVSAALGKPCASLSINPTPTAVHSGQTFTISGTISNCSKSPEMLQIEADVTGPGGTVGATNMAIQLQPGESRPVVIPITVPSPTLPGVYTIAQ